MVMAWEMLSSLVRSTTKKINIKTDTIMVTEAGEEEEDSEVETEIGAETDTVRGGAAEAAVTTEGTTETGRGAGTGEKMTETGERMTEIEDTEAEGAVGGTGRIIGGLRE